MKNKFKLSRSILNPKSEFIEIGEHKFVPSGEMFQEIKEFVKRVFPGDIEAYACGYHISADNYTVLIQGEDVPEGDLCPSLRNTESGKIEFISWNIKHESYDLGEI